MPIVRYFFFERDSRGLHGVTIFKTPTRVKASCNLNCNIKYQFIVSSKLLVVTWNAGRLVFPAIPGKEKRNQSSGRILETYENENIHFPLTKTNYITKYLLYSWTLFKLIVSFQVFMVLLPSFHSFFRKFIINIFLNETE